MSSAVPRRTSQRNQRRRGRNPMQTKSERLISETRAERERLADLLGGLSPEQWAAPSLCAGWRVGEVAAHITMPFRTRPLTFMAGVAGAGVSFNPYGDPGARSTARET